VGLILTSTHEYICFIHVQHLTPLASRFKKYLMGVDDMSLTDVRDDLRQTLHAKYPTEFPTGTAGTSAVKAGSQNISH
jgi:hypothetical protein